MHLDDYETHDDRRILPGTGFTVEPGLYFDAFGVRTEINVFRGERTALVTHTVVIPGRAKRWTPGLDRRAVFHPPPAPLTVVDAARVPASRSCATLVRRGSKATETLALVGLPAGLGEVRAPTLVVASTVTAEQRFHSRLPFPGDQLDDPSALGELLVLAMEDGFRLHRLIDPETTSPGSFFRAIGDLQRAMGDEKKPWEIGKSFDRSAPIGPIHKVAQTGHFTKGAIWLKVNGQLKQNANLNQMIWSVAEQISKLSEAFELMPGDIIYSGTPENVGPVVRGDVMDGHIDGLPETSDDACYRAMDWLHDVRDQLAVGERRAVGGRRRRGVERPSTPPATAPACPC